MPRYHDERDAEASGLHAVNAKDLRVGVATDSTTVAYATGVFVIAKHGPPERRGFLRDVGAVDRLRNNAWATPAYSPQTPSLT